MFQHVGALTLVETATDDNRTAIADALRALVGVVPGLQDAKVIVDSRLREGNSDVLFVMTFDSRESWLAYGPHEAHQAVVKDHIAPVLASKTFVQTEGPVFLT